MADHTVIVPDLRGMGLSSHPEGGYEKTSQARDLASILDRLVVEQVTLVTHDIGNMVGYALAAQFPQRVTKWIVMDAPLPGLGTWEKQLVNPGGLALQLSRARCRASGGRSGTHSARSLLQRAVSESGGD